MDKQTIGDEVTQDRKETSRQMTYDPDHDPETSLFTNITKLLY